MGKYFRHLKTGIGRQFIKRVFIMSLPAAILFSTLVIFEWLTIDVAVMCYLITLISNIFMLFPISSELQSLRNYIESLASGKVDDIDINLSEKDTKDLAQAITSIHRLWTSKTDALEAQALSDAAIFDTFPDPILMLDGEGNLIGSNLAARQFLGTDAIGTNIDHLFSTNIFIASIEKGRRCRCRRQGSADRMAGDA